jgi:nucleoside-diphosphate-sugar epimerase
VCDEPFEHDVRQRVPAVDKARDRLGFVATTTLDEMLDIVVPWVLDAIDRGLIEDSAADANRSPRPA